MLRFVCRFGKPAVALGLALLLLQAADAQPGSGGKRKGGDNPPAEDVKASPELQTWIKTLTEKMTDRQDSIRDSARAALIAVGRPALPELQKLVDGKDAAAAEAAKVVIARIERGGGRTGGGSGSGFPGGPGGNPMGPGGGRPGGGNPGTGNPAPGGPPALGTGSVDAALKDLDLSEKQKTKLEEIKAAQLKKMSDLLDKLSAGKIDRDELRVAYEKNREEMLKDIESVLTRDQKDQFEKALKDTPRNPGGPGGNPGGPGGNPGGPGGGPGGPGGRPGGPGGPGGGFGFPGGFGGTRAISQALKDLDLTEKQQAKVEKILAAQQDKATEMMEKLRDGKLDRQEIQTAMQKFQDELVKDIKDVLTKEQAEKLDKAIKDAPRGPGGRGPGGPGGGPGGGRGGPGGGGGPGGDRPNPPERRID